MLAGLQRSQAAASRQPKSSRPIMPSRSVEQSHITSMPDSTSPPIGLEPDHKDFPATPEVDGFPLVTTAKDGRALSEDGVLLPSIGANCFEDRWRRAVARNVIPTVPVKKSVVWSDDSGNPGRLTKAGAMQEFVTQSNIERFKKLISTTTDSSQLSTLKELLRREEARSVTLPAKPGRS